MLTVRTHTSLDPDLLAEIARDQGTPTYVYDGRVLDSGVHRWVDAVGDPARICYAVKANYNLGVLSRLASHGIGFEASTIGEMALAAADGLEPTTLAFHLGSGLDSLQPYEGAIDVLLQLVEDLKSTRAPVRELDLGGGLGVAYDEGETDLEPADLVRIVEDRLAGTDLTVRYEPGRDVGAYGFVIASNYNARPRPAEILVDDSGWRVVRFREALEDLWRGEIAG